MSSTSTSLLQRLREQPQPHDWERLVDLYRPFLTGFLRGQGAGDADAEDLTQEILAVVVREMPAFRHSGCTGAFRAFLRAREIISGEGSMPTTLPAGPTLCLATMARVPVPQPTSRTDSPGARRASWASRSR